VTSIGEINKKKKKKNEMKLLLDFNTLMNCFLLIMKVENDKS